METTAFLIIVAIGAVAWAALRDRQRVRNYQDPATTLSPRHTQFVTEACHEGLRCIGYSCVPGCDSPAAAAKAGAAYCSQHDARPVLTASLVAAGMVAHYAAQHRLAEANTAALLSEVNAMFAAGFPSTADEIHDARAKLVAGNKDANDVLGTVTREGFSSSILAQNGAFSVQLRGLAGASHAPMAH